MTELFTDKSKIFWKIREIILKPNSSVNVISSELEQSKDVKDLKSVVDFLIREEVLQNLKLKEIDKVKSYLKLSTELSRKDLSNPALPFVLFSDVLNSLTIQSCENFFSFMEECILKLKDTSVFVSGRALLLRICNDLLRRLSKSQNTVFCGKILIFLSRLFPLDEKSGLNLMGHFNTDNLTPYNETLVDSELCQEISIDLTDDISEDMEINAIIKVNKGFYKKFWILQDYFRNSIQCYDDANFAIFSSSVDEILSFFSKFRVNLETSNSESLKADWSSFSHADMTFTKYLTSEKLFDLQLMDPNFRRCILVQLAVTFQYLLAPIKFKTPEQVLKEDQLKWVEKQQIELQKLLEGLSSEREPFADIVKLVLNRENNKSSWKNDGCPSFVKKRAASSLNTQERDCDKRKCRIQVDRNGRQIVSFDTNSELSRLWNICPDNLSACRDPRRIYNPDLTEYFANARLELDPEEKVEEKYRSINDERWCWASLRLLSRKSQHFYTNWQNPGQAIKQYLTTIIVDKLTPRACPGDDVNNDNVDSQEPDAGRVCADDDSCSPKNDVGGGGVVESMAAGGVDGLSIIVSHLNELALLIGDRWKRIAEACHFAETDVVQIEALNHSEETDFMIGNKMLLNLWMENKSGLVPTLPNLISLLDEIGFDDIVSNIKTWSE